MVAKLGDLLGIHKENNSSVLPVSIHTALGCYNLYILHMIWLLRKWMTVMEANMFSTNAKFGGFLKPLFVSPLLLRFQRHKFRSFLIVSLFPMVHPPFFLFSFHDSEWVIYIVIFSSSLIIFSVSSILLLGSFTKVFILKILSWITKGYCIFQFQNFIWVSFISLFPCCSFLSS